MRKQQEAEALLYIHSDGITESEILSILSITTIEWRAIESALSEKYNISHSGILFSRYGDTYVLETHPKMYSLLSDLIPQKTQKSLSQQAMEVLAIIAYKQPITRLEVEQIRGVQSTSVFDTLLSRGFIKEAGRLEAIGKPYIYKTTDAFLHHFSMQSLDELPPLEIEVDDAD